MSGKYPGGFVTLGAPAGYSVAFDGAGDYLTIPTNAALNLGTGDFTIEGWVYPTANSGDWFIISSTGTSGMFFGVRNSSAPTGFGYGRTGVAWDYVTSVNPTTNTWQHIAITRSGTSIRLFLNGTQIGATQTSSQAYDLSVTATSIGSQAANYYLTGYMSNLRVLKGTALYTANFTPPTQLFPIANTQLLTCQSPNIIDNSNNAFAITANGNAAVSNFTPFTGYTAGASGFQPALGAAAPGVWTLDEATNYQGTRRWPIYDPSFNLTTSVLHGNNPTNLPTWITDASSNSFTFSQFGAPKGEALTPFDKAIYPTSGSAYFNGSTDYLTAPNNTAFDFSTSNHTVECWVYLQASSAAVRIIEYRNGSASNSNYGYQLYAASGVFSYAVFAGNTQYTATGATGALNQWYHVAGVRNGTTITVYVNGVAGGTTATVPSTTNNPAGSVLYVSSDLTSPVTGYVSNVRLTKGVSVYSGNFTTPTAPLATTQSSGTNISAITGTQVSLLSLQNAQPNTEFFFCRQLN
jgi:hypothetical protein